MSSITLRQGDTWQRTATFTFALGNLTGAKVWMTIKRSPATQADADANLQIDTDVGGVAVLTTTTAQFTITDVQSAGLAPGRYSFDVQVRLSTGEIYTTDSGEVTVLQQVTRATS